MKGQRHFTGRGHRLRPFSSAEILPTDIPFTTEMLSGKVFQPDGEPGEVDLIQFSADGTGADYHSYSDDMGGEVVEMFSWNWSIDGEGRLIVDNLDPADPDAVGTLLADIATYLDVQVNDGITTENERLNKVISFDEATLPGTYSVSNGMTGTLSADGTGSASDGSQTINFTWSVDTAGVLSLTFTGGTNTDYLLATSTSPSILYVVGISQDSERALTSVFADTLTRQ